MNMNLLLGSLGPSTVTLMALLYVTTWGGEELMDIVKVKLLPVKNNTYIRVGINL